MPLNAVNRNIIASIRRHQDASILVIKFFRMLALTTPPTPKAGCDSTGLALRSSGGKGILSAESTYNDPAHPCERTDTPVPHNSRVPLPKP